MGWLELFMNCTCPKCNREIAQIARVGDEVRVLHEGGNACSFSLDELRQNGVSPWRIRFVNAALRARRLREWFEELRQGVCPKCGQGVGRVKITSGRLYAAHGDGRMCHIARLDALERLGLSVDELRNELRGAMMERERERLRGWLETLRQGVCPRCGREVVNISASHRGAIFAKHGDGSTCYITYISKLKRLGLSALEVLEIKGSIKGRGAEFAKKLAN